MKPHTISNDAQLNSNGRLSHLLGLEGLPKNQIEKILDVADDLIDKKGNLQKTKILRDMSLPISSLSPQHEHETPLRLLEREPVPKR